MNLENLLENVGNDKNLLLEVIDMFFTDSITQLEKIKNYLETEDSVRLIESLHSLKGIVSHFDQDEVFNLCVHLQRLAESKDFASINGKYFDLDIKIKHICKQLEDYQRALKP